ncbi:GATA zinc finger domain-containing protein 14 isoform X2 [Condylostylus longicornis]|uniref:GATA zinc finger domain-containing protein 14 isoform X2 n=1 Tax=Condylostylus longicornis TaxID=2530218 RepID=UPI00244DA57D|nr:GATA zinc finger domain-containing protein 14 isoform X2 [Condylostylus longicornis]
MADVVVPVTVENEAVPDSPSSGADLEKQHSFEKSTTTTSHHHDSEYDTASDLEGGEEDYDEENDESGDEDDKDEDLEGSGSETGSEYDEEDEERQRGDGQEQIDNVKKVDEDRSNPQYIPKKGTFYEHDDRTTDEPEVVEISKSTAEGNCENAAKATVPTISSASKTMKKWQPASVVDRWSHDRYDENEQAPKSRAELVSAYGYDIRSEDGPPRARRRRRYGRGPSKYNRKWEDESAYIKSNTHRRPPKAEDFPALNEKKSRRNSRKHRDEKENRFDNKNLDSQLSKRENFGRADKTNRNSKNYRSGTSGSSNNQNRRSMEFKNKNRGIDEKVHFDNNRHADENNVRIQPIPANRNFDDYTNKQVDTRQQIQQHQQPSISTQASERFNNGFNDNLINYNSQNHGNSPGSNQFLSRDMKDPKLNQNHVANQTKTSSQILSQSVQNKQSNIQNNQLQTRLQQVQNRNDPSHVGSVQMHSLASQQQSLHQQGSSSSNTLSQNIIPADLNQQPEQGRPKRYSSLRQRNQTDQSVMQQIVSPTPAGLPNASPHQQIDQHSIQQMHLQHDHVAVAAAAAHQQQQALLQANLIQLYQDNLQAQQVGVPAITNLNQSKTTASTNVPQTSQFPGIVHNSQFPSQPAAGSAPAYYSPGPNEYAVGPPNVPGTAPQPPYAIPYGPQTQPPPNVQQATPSQTAQPNSLSANPTAPFTNYPPPNSSSQYPATVSPAQQFNTVGGTTYFVPHTQPTQRQSSLPQRRPTNAIPILPPSDKNKSSNSQQTNGSSLEKENNSNAPAVGSVENIDHILDNMFVQRQPFQPAIQQSSSQTSIVSNASTTASTTSSQGNNTQKASENRIDEAIKNLSIVDSDSTINLSEKSGDNSASEAKTDKSSNIQPEGSLDIRDPK